MSAGATLVEKRPSAGVVVVVVVVDGAKENVAVVVGFGAAKPNEVPAVLVVGPPGKFD